MIDGPGLEDTREEKTNKDWASNLFNEIYSHLQYVNKIDGFIFLWSPTVKYELNNVTFDLIRQGLYLPNDEVVSKSLLFITNRDSSKWQNKDDEKNYSKNIEKIMDMGYKIHSSCDLKNEKLDECKNNMKMLKPFKIEIFEENYKKEQLGLYRQKVNEYKKRKAEAAQNFKDYVQEMSRVFIALIPIIIFVVINTFTI